MRSLDVFTNPRSIAIIGASDDVRRIGGRPLSYLLRCGYAGAIYPVNAKRATVQGQRAYASVLDVPEAVDCAIVVVPAEHVNEAVAQCAAAGVKGAVVFTAGFAEIGSEGITRQQALVHSARSTGMRILGPNCLGAFCTRHRSYLTFSGVFDDVVGTAGRYGFVGQSGGFAGEIIKIAQGRDIHFDTWITTGNEADVELGEVLSHLAQDEGIDVIAAFMEGARNGTAFLHGLTQARRCGKPVVVLKAGRTAAGAAAVRSHTAGLAGADEVYDAVFEQYGVHRARSIEEMLDVLCALRRKTFVRGRRLGIVTTSGGNGALAADFAIDAGFRLAPPDEATQRAIVALSENAAVSNPVDLTAKVANEPAILGQCIEMMLEGGQYDCLYVFVGLVAGIAGLGERLLQVLEDLTSKYPSVPIVLSVTAPDATVRRYEAAGYLCVHDPARAMQVLGALARIGSGGCPQGPARDGGAQGGDVPQRRQAPRLTPGRTYNEVEGKQVLQAIGVACLPEVVVSDAAAGQRAAATMGGRLALKIVSRDIPHKTDVGGVVLDLPPERIGEAIDRMAERVRAAMPQARIDGYLISPMLADVPQFFIGVHRDPVLGAVIVAGAGGVAVELLRDVSCHLAPVDRAQARAMLERLKSFPLLNGYRGRPVADVEALIDSMVSISAFAAGQGELLQTFEINPIAVLPAGQGVMALDAVIETGTGCQPSSAIRQGAQGHVRTP